MPRYTGPTPQTLTLAGNTYTIPAKTYISVNTAALHTSPQNWGPDPTTFRPSRFLSSSPEEEPIVPLPGTYMAWSMGPRVCPGKKFAQVEFVAVISKLLQKHRIRPVVEAGETMDMACGRLKSVVMDSDLFLTLNMRHPEKARVWIEERK